MGPLGWSGIPPSPKCPHHVQIERKFAAYCSELMLSGWWRRAALTSSSQWPACRELPTATHVRGASGGHSAREADDEATKGDAGPAQPTGAGRSGGASPDAGGPDHTSGGGGGAAARRLLTDLRHPALWFPQARALSRTIVAHLGPTNSGKTHQALQALQAAPTGLYCGPLRLLACEVGASRVLCSALHTTPCVFPARAAP